MNPDPRPTSTQAAFSGQQQPAAPRDPRRGRIVLPFDPQPVDLGTWTYEHKVGLCVMIIAYLVLGIIFVTTKLVVGGAPPDQHTIYLDMVPPPPEQKQELTPEERRQMEADLSNAHNAISNEDARNEASRQNAPAGPVRAARRAVRTAARSRTISPTRPTPWRRACAPRAKPTNAACAKNRR